MKRSELAERTRTMLSERRAALRGALAGELSQLGRDDDFESLDDEAYFQLAEWDSHELELIEETLERIRDGRFGICQHCGRHIALPRLQVLPYAKFCIECQRAAEADPSGKEEQYA